jgi:adenine-specific DNA-methyltransferase
MAKSGKAKGDTNSAGTEENGSSSGPEARQVLQGGPEPFDLRSHTVAEERKGELLRLFPEARTEGEKVDFNRLKLALGDSVDVGKERYGLTWPGKADCFRAIQTPSLGTLLPAPAESVNWDSTENMIIEGDNLEVLKLLQKSYLGKVKMIYIDPPYNTGNDFIYPDNYAESLQTYLEYTGQVDSQGKKFSTNTDTEGRFHSKWLNMMYPRLYLARNLLRDDGVIFVSIDDVESSNLRLMLADIFGEENLLAQLVWNLRTGTTAGHFTRSHEYIVAYARNKLSLPNFSAEEGASDICHGALKRISRGNPASIIEFPAGMEFEGDTATFSGELGGDERQIILSDKMVFEKGRLKHPVKIKAGWAMRNQVLSWIAGEETIDSKGQEVKRFYFNKKGILWYEKERGTINPKTVLSDLGSTKSGSSELVKLFGFKAMDYPKPVSLIQYLVQTVTTKDSIIMDFFAGSGTTAQAVLDANSQDRGNRRFILVQLPEPTPEDSEARKAGFPTISSFCEERVRRVLKAMDGAAGFRILRLAESNFKVWDSARPEHPDVLQRRLTDHIHHIREGRSEQDILTELLLKSGFPPTVSVQEVSVAEKKAFVVGDGELLICLDRHLTREAIRAIADLHPKRVVCLDEGFEGDDQLKVNAAQTFKTKGVTSFQTV